MTEAITDNSDEARFELHSGGELAALLAYKREDGLLALTHAETRDGFTGQGLAGQVTAYALARAREEGLGVLPFCPYVKAYLVKHPDQIDVVPAEHRARFGLDG